MEFGELFRKAYLLPAAGAAGLSLVLFLIAWRHERRDAGYSLLLLGLVWVAGHLLVDANSYLFPPKESANWMVFGAAGLALAAGVSWIMKRGDSALTIVAALLLAVAAWLALQKLPWLLDRAETSAQREAWSAGFIAAVLVSFAAAEFAARRVPAVAVAAGLAVFADLSGLTLWQLAMPEPVTARLFAVAGLAAGAVVAAWLCCAMRARPGMMLPRGMAGWIAGGSVLLFILGCLSRAGGIPMEPLTAAAAGLPLAAVVALAAARLRPGSAGPIFVAVAGMCGAGMVWLAAREVSRPAPAAEESAPTGADDTGAYEGY